MSNLQLPIDLIPNTNPPRFHWQQIVNTLIGTTTQDCEGVLPQTIEKPVEELIRIAKQALMDNAILRGQVDSMTNQLSKRTEETPFHPKPNIAQQVAPQPISLKKK